MACFAQGPAVASIYASPEALQRRQSKGHEVCAHFKKTGHCRYGDGCMYAHPHMYAVRKNSEGLPLRPSEPVCGHYQKHGTCKFGPACMFHHPERERERERERGGGRGEGSAGPAPVNPPAKMAWRRPSDEGREPAFSRRRWETTGNREGGRW